MPAPVYFLVHEDELSVQPEVTYGVKPGVAAAADFFKHTSTRVGITRKLDRYYRDQDRDFQQASVKSAHTGRQSTGISIDGDLIPNGSAVTPTAPDTNNFWKALFGSGTTLTGHTTTGAGTVGTALVLAAGGGVASGIRVGGGDLIAVDVDATNGVEVRRVVSRTVDAVVLDRALTADPAAGQNVYVGTTYNLSTTTLISLYLWLWNGAIKYQYPGLSLSDGSITVDFSQKTPVAKQKFAGEASVEVPNADARPTPTTHGIPLVPSKGKVWFGTTKLAAMINMMISIKSGLELRNVEASQLSPTGVKRTGNNARWLVEQSIETFFTDSMQTFYDGARTIGAIDTIVQLGTSVGNIVAWSCPKWQPDAANSENGGELGLKFSGRALGTAGDDEVSLAFI